MRYVVSLVTALAILGIFYLVLIVGVSGVSNCTKRGGHSKILTGLSPSGHITWSTICLSPDGRIIE